MQQFLAIHKNVIIKIWYLLLAVWFGFFLFSTRSLKIQEWLEWGSLSGKISLVLFWIILLPGIIKRFRIVGLLLPIRVIIMLYRRQLGIAMYVLALTHYWWSRMLPILAFGGNIWNFSRFELMGVGAFVLLTPVFFTSNEWSVRFFGKYWHTIHGLVYVVIWLLFLHVGMQDSDWKTWGTLLIASLELTSLAWARVTKAPVKIPVQNPD